MTYILWAGPQPIFPTVQLTQCPSVWPTAYKEKNLTLRWGWLWSWHLQLSYLVQDVSCQQPTCRIASSSVGRNLWVNHLTADLGREAGPMYEFDGSNGAIIPEKVLLRIFVFEFTIFTWLKHEKHINDKHLKEPFCEKLLACASAKRRP